MDFRKAVTLLQNDKSVKGRMERVPTPGQNFEMLIDFAHTPDALEKLLLTFVLSTVVAFGVFFGAMILMKEENTDTAIQLVKQRLHKVAK